MNIGLLKELFWIELQSVLQMKKKKKSKVNPDSNNLIRGPEM